MLEKGVRGGICHSIHRYAKANGKYMKDYDENKELSYFQFWVVNNLHGRAMSQKLSVKNFSGLKIFLNLMKVLYKFIMEKVIKDIFLKLMFNILKHYIILTMIYPFCQKE